MVARLYSWDDAGALVLDSVTGSGSLLNILRACLVDGYGTRTDAGWTMPFSDLINNVGCFKPGNGDNVHLRIDDDYTYRYALVRGYAGMTDHSTGSGEWPTNDQIEKVDAKLSVGKRLKNTAGYERWHVIATEGWFYYWSPDMLRSTPSGFFFGKMETFNPNHVNNYLLTANAVDSNLTPNPQYETLFTASLSTDWWLMNSYFNTGVSQQLSHEYLTQTQFANPSPADGQM